MNERLTDEQLLYLLRQVDIQAMRIPSGVRKLADLICEKIQSEVNSCIRYEQHRAERIGTHGPGCETWGPAHYECAVREIEQQRLSEEGAKEAFAHVVQQKRDLETERKRLGGLLDDAYKIIRQKELELAASREREARMRGVALLLRGRLLMENPNAVTDDADAALAEGAQG